MPKEKKEVWPENFSLDANWCPTNLKNSPTGLLRKQLHGNLFFNKAFFNLSLHPSIDQNEVNQKPNFLCIYKNIMRPACLIIFVNQTNLITECDRVNGFHKLLEVM